MPLQHPVWSELRAVAALPDAGRFGWVTRQILADKPSSPAHDETSWRRQWRAVAADYRSWASRATRPVTRQP
jgi:hypothetical protein